MKLDHVSTRSLLAFSMSNLTRVHQRWAHFFNKKGIAFTFSFFESSPSDKFSTIPRNDRIASGSILTPPEKICGCRLLRMSCKILFLPFSLFLFLFSSCPSISCISLKSFVLFILFSLFPSCLGWSLPILEVCNEWVEKEEEVRHAENLAFLFFSFHDYMHVSP